MPWVRSITFDDTLKACGMGQAVVIDSALLPHAFSVQADMWIRVPGRRSLRSLALG